MKILVPFIALFFNSFFLTSQIVDITSFDRVNTSNAFNIAMKSKYDTLVFRAKNSPYILRPMRFEKIMNKTIVLEEGVEIQAAKGAFVNPNDALMKFLNCSKISILGNGATLSMNKDEYLDGEWRHVIRISGSKNITLKDLILRDSGGDGIEIGGFRDIVFSEDIEVVNVQSYNNKRQGMSIISAKNVLVKNSIFAGTYGTAPGAGLDIEPDDQNDILINIKFENCIFRDNYYAGINIGLVKLTSDSTPVSIDFSDCFLTNNFCHEPHKIPAEIIVKSNKLNPVKGKVLFNKISVENSQWPFLYAKLNVIGFDVLFDNCVAKNICQSGKGSAIFLETPHYKEITEMGGLFFGDFTMEYIPDVPIITVRGSGRRAMKRLKDVQGNFIMSIQKTKPFNYIHYNPSENENVSLDITLQPK